MHYLIDGHNLIGKLADASLDDPHDEAKLVRRLKSWVAAGPKRRITLFFDGGLVGGKSVELSGGGVTVIFAPSDRSADALIIQRIQKLRHPAENTVVSSDQQIMGAAGRRRVPTVTAEAFALQLKQVRAKAETTEQPILSEAEVADWLNLFGPEPVPKRKRRQRPAAKTVPEPPAEPNPAGGAGTSADETTEPPLNVVKRTSHKLSEEEVAAWLELFNQAKKK
jgi:uncharacterized protein